LENDKQLYLKDFGNIIGYRMIEYFLQDLTMGMTDIVLMLCRIFFMTNSALKHTRLSALLKYAT